MVGHVLGDYRGYTRWLSVLASTVQKIICVEVETSTCQQRHYHMGVPTYEVRVTSNPIRTLRDNTPSFVRAHQQLINYRASGISLLEHDDPCLCRLNDPCYLRS